MELKCVKYLEMYWTILNYTWFLTQLQGDPSCKMRSPTSQFTERLSLVHDECTQRLTPLGPQLATNLDDSNHFIMYIALGKGLIEEPRIPFAGKKAGAFYQAQMERILDLPTVTPIHFMMHIGHDSPGFRKRTSPPKDVVVYHYIMCMTIYVEKKSLPVFVCVIACIYSCTNAYTHVYVANIHLCEHMFVCKYMCKCKQVLWTLDKVMVWYTRVYTYKYNHMDVHHENRETGRRLQHAHSYM